MARLASTLSLVQGLEQPAPEDRLQVRWIGSADIPRWDQFVSDHPNGCVQASGAWKRAMEEAFPHVSGCFLALEEPGTRRITAGLPIYTVKSWALRNRLVCVPFAAWCDPLVRTPRELALLLEEAGKFGEETSARFTEVRVRNTTRILKACGLVEARRWLHHYVSLNETRDDLWHKLSRTAVRRLVRSAEKTGVLVTREKSCDALHLFHNLLSETRRRMGLPRIPFRLFQAIQSQLETGGCTLLLAGRGGIPLGGVLATRCKNTFHLEYAGVVAEDVPLGTMQLLYWRAMEVAQEQGSAEFSFGRTDPGQSGLVAYKRHWGSVEEELTEFRFGGRRSPGWRAARGLRTGLARTLLRRLPSPLYRAASDLLYRHR